MEQTSSFHHQSGELATKLTIYLDQDEFLQAVYKSVKIAFVRANLAAHNWEHIYRDTLNAIVIGEAEGADMAIVLPAILLHDHGFLYGGTGKTHAEVGAAHLGQFLAENNIVTNQEHQVAIAACIRTHKGNMHGQQPASLEAKVVCDADLLEKFGPLGVYQEIRTRAEFGQGIVQTLERNDVLANVHAETKTGQQLLDARLAFTRAFYTAIAEGFIPYQDRK